MSQQTDAEAFWRKIQGMDLPEIADEINRTEGFVWTLEHDAADGRVGGDVDASTQAIRGAVREMAEIFARKAGIDADNMSLMRQRIQEELAHFEVQLAEKWAKIFKVGAVFQHAENTARFEVVGIYVYASVGSEQAVLARLQSASSFSVFDSRLAADLTPIDAEPLYVGDTTTFLRAVGGGVFPSVRMFGNDIRETGAVFAFKGDGPRQGVWETFYNDLCNANADGEDGDETVVIARNQDRPAVAEFTAADLPGIRVLLKPRRFVRRITGGYSVPELDLAVDSAGAID